MKLKLVAALAALLIAGMAGAQDRDPKLWQKAKDRVENMAQYVKMDAATTEKVTEAMYKCVVEYADAGKKRSSMTNEEWKAKSAEMFKKWKNETNTLLNEEQKAGYNEWLKVPVAERYKKISK